LDDTNCKLDGFIISGGNANSTSSLTVETRQLFHNSSGGLVLTNTQLVVENSVIQFHQSLVRGGAISLSEGSPTFKYCDFNRNKNPEIGGVMFAGGTTSLMENCNFYGNSASSAGAIELTFGANMAFRNCTFSENYAGNSGGAIRILNSNPTFENSLFFNNSAQVFAGAIRVLNFSNPDFKSCVIYGNTTASFGGGIHMRSGANGSFSNCIIWNNTATSTSATNEQGIYKSGTTEITTLTNCIVQNSTGDPLSLPNLTLVNALNSDPLFSNPANPIGMDNLWGTADDGFQLRVCSPAVDAALDAQSPTTDFAGNNRTDLPSIGTTTADIGAYELQIGTRPTLSLGSNSPVCNGTTISLSSTVTNATSVTYIWSGPQNFTSTAANPTVANFGADKAGKYFLTINADGCVLIDSVETNIIPVITYVSNLTDSKIIAACVGDIVTLGITPAFDYQSLIWQKKIGNSFIDLAVDTVYTQVNQTQLEVNGVQLTLDSTYYRVKFTTFCQEIVSDTFLLHLPNVPKIIAQPAGQVICRTDAAQLNITTSGLSLSHQWQIQVPGDTLFQNISNVKSDSSVLFIGSVVNGSLFRCVVSNDCGSRTSDTVTVSIDNTVEVFVQPIAQTVCENGTVQFSTTAFHAQGAALSYRWQI
jgi:hypothetical protein